MLVTLLCSLIHNYTEYHCHLVTTTSVTTKRHHRSSYLRRILPCRYCSLLCGWNSVLMVVVWKNLVHFVANCLFYVYLLFINDAVKSGGNLGWWLERSASKLENLCKECVFICTEVTSVRELPEWAAKETDVFRSILCPSVYSKKGNLYMSENVPPERTHSLWLDVVEVCRGWLWCRNVIQARTVKIIFFTHTLTYVKAKF